jgi:hypothetical protein
LPPAPRRAAATQNTPPSQNFIFYAITGPGPLVCAIITTTRKFFTILLSVLLLSTFAAGG